MNEFGNFIYELRKEKGITQVELANKLGVTNKAVSKWETGEAMPETSLLLPLSKILGVSVDELLNGKIKENKKEVNIEIRSQNENIGTNGHIYPKAENKTLLEKISGAVCASVFLISLSVYFFIGVITNVWSPYWVIIPVGALSCGIIGIIFDICNSVKRKEKFARGENAFVGAICGIVMLLCIITYLLLGSLLNLWHPYWIVIILGVTFCGITGAIGKIFSNDKNNKTENN